MLFFTRAIVSVALAAIFMYVETISILALSIALPSGCGSITEPHSVTGLTHAEGLYDQDFQRYYRLGDARCSPNQQQAIRAASRVNTGTATPSAAIVERFHFAFAPSSDGWEVLVWQFSRDQVPVCGGFTNVSLSRDYRVRRIIGGA